MKHLLLTSSALVLSLLPLAASAKGMTPVERFESQTHLSSQWENPENRALLEAKIKLNQSVYQKGILTLDEIAADHNGVEIQKYSDQFRCFSGEKSACHVAAKR